MVDLLRDQLIQDVLVDSEVVYIMLNNGTQITIKGVVVVEPKRSDGINHGAGSEHDFDVRTERRSVLREQRSRKNGDQEKRILDGHTQAL